MDVTTSGERFQNIITMQVFELVLLLCSLIFKVFLCSTGSWSTTTTNLFGDQNVRKLIYPSFHWIQCLKRNNFLQITFSLLATFRSSQGKVEKEGWREFSRSSSGYRNFSVCNEQNSTKQTALEKEKYRRRDISLRPEASKNRQSRSINLYCSFLSSTCNALSNSLHPLSSPLSAGNCKTCPARKLWDENEKQAAIQSSRQGEACSMSSIGSRVTKGELRSSRYLSIDSPTRVVFLFSFLPWSSSLFLPLIGSTDKPRAIRSVSTYW